MNGAVALNRFWAHKATMAQHFGVVDLVLFGAFARDQATGASNVDAWCGSMPRQIGNAASVPEWREGNCLRVSNASPRQQLAGPPEWRRAISPRGGLVAAVVMYCCCVQLAYPSLNLNSPLPCAPYEQSSSPESIPSPQSRHSPTLWRC